MVRYTRLFSHATLRGPRKAEPRKDGGIDVAVGDDEK
jgi:hypothetical protein